MTCINHLRQTLRDGRQLPCATCHVGSDWILEDEKQPDAWTVWMEQGQGNRAAPKKLSLVRKRYRVGGNGSAVEPLTFAFWVEGK